MGIVRQIVSELLPNGGEIYNAIVVVGRGKEQRRMNSGLSFIHRVEFLKVNRYSGPIGIQS